MPNLLQERLQSLAKTRLRKMVLSIVKTGHLQLELPDGDRLTAGDGTGPMIRARITRWPVLLRLLAEPEMAVGEAYMDGGLTLEQGGIYDLLFLVVSNLNGNSVPGPSRLLRGLAGMVARRGGYNSRRKSRANVAHHYDLDGRLYDLFLDADAQYSCAYFEEGCDDLDAAQLAKKRHLAAKLDLRPGQRVLDIGSGWGGMALYMARLCQVSVTGVTLSTEQLGIARQRARNAGLGDRVAFELQDYRDVRQKFDRIVSVGMFEHVGPKSYREFFETLKSLLAPDGVAVLHYIGRTTRPFPTSPWIRKYIFPGGYMPSLSEVLPEIEKQGLIVTDIEVLRQHYAETLRHWSKRFAANRDKAVALYDERFARMWEFYLAGSETGFRTQELVIHQIQICAPGAALPLTRDYMRDTEQRLREREQPRQIRDLAATRPATAAPMKVPA